MSTHGQLLITVLQAHLEQQADMIAYLRREARGLCVQLRRARRRIETLERRLPRRAVKRAVKGG